jgi:N-acetylglutamate synthase-like GNAT family acetyltransferase
MTEQPPFRIEKVDVEVVRPLRRRLLRPDQDEDAVVYASDDGDSAQHFAAYDGDDEVIGIGSLHNEDRMAGREPYGSPGMRIRGMAVEDAWRGRGVGAALLERMLVVARESGIAEAWANARSANLGFYERSGFRAMSSEFELPGIGPHVVMARDPAERKRKKKRRKPAPEGDAGPEAATD